MHPGQFALQYTPTRHSTISSKNDRNCIVDLDNNLRQLL